MATKPDLKAQKERKQKIILAVGGVLLLGLLAFQLPKLLKHSSSTPAAAPATTPGAVATTPTAAPGGTPAPVNVSASKSSAQLAGVVLSTATRPSASEGQLWSFSRFKQKDPFVPQVEDTTSGGSATPGSSPSSTAAGAGGKAGGAAGGGGGSPGTPATPAVLAYATLFVNGRSQQLTIKDVFPKADPIFILAKLGDKTARIGVAGGAFTNGATILLELGKRVTLMNTTTGQRFVVKLVYVGAQPETIAAFKGGKATGVPSTVSSTP